MEQLQKITIQNTVNEAVMVTINNRSFAIDLLETNIIEFYKPRKISIENPFPALLRNVYLIGNLYKLNFINQNDLLEFKIVRKYNWLYLLVFGLIFSLISIYFNLKYIPNKPITHSILNFLIFCGLPSLYHKIDHTKIIQNKTN